MEKTAAPSLQFILKKVHVKQCYLNLHLLINVNIVVHVSSIVEDKKKQSNIIIIIQSGAR